MRPKVSVIVPVYNTERYLRRCIDSIINQTLRGIEIILVDDGSTDCSGAICDEYAERIENITVVHQKNCGVAWARNSGLEIATGEYIGFVDSDDYIDARMYEKLYNSASKDNIDIITCGYYIENADNRVRTNKSVNIPKDRVIKKKELNSIIFTANKTRILWFVWKSIYKKSLLDKNSIAFNTELRLGEDSPFVLECMMCARSMYYINEPLYYYVQTPDSLTRKKYRPGLLELLNNIYLDKLRLYNKYGFKGCYTNDLDDYTMSHTLPILLSNEISGSTSINELTNNYRKMRETEMIKSAFDHSSLTLINSKLKYLALLLKLRLYLPLAIITKIGRAIE